MHFRSRRFALKGAIETLYAAQCFIELVKNVSEVPLDLYDHVSLPFFLSLQAAVSAMRIQIGYQTHVTDAVEQSADERMIDLTRRTFSLASLIEDAVFSMRKRIEAQTNRIETDEIEEAISTLILEAEAIVSVYDEMNTARHSH